VRLHRDTVPGVHRIEDFGVNWYLIEDAGALTVVDAGVMPSWRSLRRTLAAIGRGQEDIRALILTHAHFDHVGFAERARRTLGVPVWCHADEVELTRHPARYAHERSRLPYALRRHALPNIARLMGSGGLARPMKEVRTFADGETLDVPGAPRVVATPGHTFGHCAFHLAERETVIAGDALVTHDPYTDTRGPRIVARAATADSERALASLERIAATGARVVLPGHGEPWRDGAAEAARLAREAGAA
jgi:glyoxylase-like metal-dependent hydrolase (beta-lactamase superfamily II)